MMFELIQTTRRVQMIKMKSQQGIHHGQGHVLGVLMDHDNISQKQLAAALDIRPASLTDLLEKLERDQLVERTRDTKDRRVTRVQITDRGKQMVQQNLKVRHQVEQVMFGALTPAEVQSLGAILNKMTTSLRTQISDQP